jgi:aryl-alcohol dehydrogenase-like predicted oxidoreductase
LLDRFKRTGKREDIFLATKFGFKADLSVDGSPEYMRQAVAASLAKLGVESIDLYYLHVRFPSTEPSCWFTMVDQRADTKVPIEHTIGAMAELIKYVVIFYHIQL